MLLVHTLIMAAPCIAEDADRGSERDVRARVEEWCRSIDALDSNSTPKQTEGIITEVAKMAEAINGKTRDEWGKKENASVVALGRVVVHFFRNTTPESLELEEESRSEVYRLAKLTLETDEWFYGPNTLKRAVHAAVVCAPSKEEARELLIEILRKQKLCAVPAAEIAPNGVLDEDVAVRLRRIALESLRQDMPNYCVLDLLGDCGDVGILADLRKIMESNEASEDVTFLARQVIWKTEIQNPPSRLLDFLEAGTQDHWAVSQDEGTAWIVNRAVQLGLDRNAIRRAASSYYERCDPKTLFLMRGQGLDDALIKNGIMTREELPERSWDEHIATP